MLLLDLRQILAQGLDSFSQLGFLDLPLRFSSLGLLGMGDPLCFPYGGLGILPLQ